NHRSDRCTGGRGSPRSVHPQMRSLNVRRSVRRRLLAAPRRGVAVALTSFTALCRLRDAVDRDDAEQLLTDLPDGVHSPFACSDRTHFARLQIISELRLHVRRPLASPVLVWSCDVDDDAHSYLVELLTLAAGTLAPVLALCADAPSDPTDADFAT